MIAQMKLDSLSPELQQRLLEVLDDYQRDLEKGTAPSTEEILARHPELADSLREYLGCLDLLHQACDVHPEALPAATPLPEAPGGQLGDYQIIRQIGRGGMGVVYEARQLSLDRRVALKVLPFAALLDPKQVARFQNEARAAGQLHHANIVPVYSVGCDRGVHYYAMQYIEGQSLDAAIRHLRQTADTLPHGPVADRETSHDLPATRPEHPAADAALSTLNSVRPSDYYRNVANLGIQAADALHHAHECGVVHRDIKPSNLLLDAQGTLWITDFGLARCKADVTLTATGDVMGTVCTMSPEQAAGQNSLIDHRTDIYSLGITLYELLTLQPAFEGNDRQQMLRMVAEREPRSPRQVVPAIPVDLETIVLKAISKSPQHRYATALEMAEDLRRFLRHEPVLARRPTLADRAIKWARRHQALVAATVVLSTLATIGLSVALVVISRAESRTAAALIQSQANYHEARQAVDRYVMQFSEELADVPGAERLRRELLGDALHYYRDFIGRAGDDPALLADTAVAHGKVATIAAKLSDRKNALDSYAKAMAILEDLSHKYPNVEKYRDDLALCCNNLGQLQSEAEQFGAAEANYRRAASLLEPLARDVRDTSRACNHLAMVQGNLGSLCNQMGNAAEAGRWFREAIRRQEELARQYPDRPEYQAQLALSYGNLSHLESKPNPAGAETHCKAAIELQKKLVAGHPHVVRYAGDLAMSYNNLGAIESHTKRLSQAEASYQEAINLGRRICREAPSVVQYQYDLAVTFSNLGRTQSQSGRLVDAAESFQAARSLLEPLLAETPQDPRTPSLLGGVLNNLAMALEQQNRLPEAETTYRRAIECQESALKRTPGMSLFREYLSKHYANYASLLRREGKASEALEVSLRRKRLWPGNPEQLRLVATELALAAGEPVDAAHAAARTRSVEEALAALREAVAAGYDKSEILRQDPNLESLRQRPEFADIVEAAEKSGKSRPPDK